MLSLRARLYNFLIQMDRIKLEDVPEPYRGEIAKSLEV